jgi:hypothetical protein
VLFVCCLLHLMQAEVMELKAPLNIQSTFYSEQCHSISNCCICHVLHLLQAEVMELKAPVDVPATGVVVEAQVRI